MAELRPFAETGVPRRVTLASDFAELVPAILEAEAKGEGAGLWNRFKGNMAAVVTVRRVGNVEGDDTSAILARMVSIVAAFSGV